MPKHGNVWPLRTVTGALATDGLGRVGRVTGHGIAPLRRHDLAFDNHLVALPL